MSSFRKKNVQKPIPGTRTSPHSGQVITSSGNPSLDVILGGGLPLGSICLIEEDKYVTHSKVLAKYFLAEGIVSQQFTFLGSLDEDPVTLLNKLPKPINEDEVEKEKVEENIKNGEEAPKNGLRIAWRYNDLPMVNSEQTPTKIGHHFNLVEHMDPLLLECAEIAIWNDSPHQQNAIEESSEEEEEINITENIEGAIGDTAANKENPTHTNNDDDNNDGNEKSNENENSKNAAIDETTNCSNENNSPAPAETEAGSESMDADVTHQLSANSTTTTTATASSDTSGSTIPGLQPQKIFENTKYLRLLSEIQQLLRMDKFIPGTSAYKSVCRICLTSLGSPCWYDDNFERDILKFFTILRSLVRSAFAVCFITVPMNLVEQFDKNLVSKIRNLVDFSIELESFAGSDMETNPAYKEYNGLLHLRKITALNALTAYMPETSDLAFKLRRKKFVIEKLHLPPELQDNKESNGEIKKPTLNCSSSSMNSSNNSNASLDF